MVDTRWPYRPLLDLIGRAEGTDPPRGRGYNETLNYGAYTGGPINLVGMTLGEVDALQTMMLRHPQNKLNSSAAGRYQIVRTTLREIKTRLTLSDAERFDEAMQDRLGCYLLGKRGVDRMIAGTMSEDAFVNNLAKEWASLPTTKGVGHYKGQSAAVSVSQVRAAIAAVRERASLPEPPVVPPPPPQEPDTPPAWKDVPTVAAVAVILAVLAKVFGWELSEGQLSAIADEMVNLAPEMAILAAAISTVVSRLRKGVGAIVAWRRN